MNYKLIQSLPYLVVKSLNTLLRLQVNGRRMYRLYCAWSILKNYVAQSLKFANQCRGEGDEAERTRVRDETDLRNALKIDKLQRPLVLGKINEQREILKLPAIIELTKQTSFKDGLATLSSKSYKNLQ